MINIYIYSRRRTGERTTLLAVAFATLCVWGVQNHQMLCCALSWVWFVPLWVLVFIGAFVPFSRGPCCNGDGGNDRQHVAISGYFCL